ncbi:MAG: DNA mismatch repair endonuclease MutH [Pseudomonadota bacterium]
MSAPPQTESELLDRARQICGLTLSELAVTVNVPLPKTGRNAKGWAGELLEIALGATAGSRPVADFEQLAIELKSIPIGPTGRPKESTFVSTLNLRAPPSERWENSTVWRKLRRVLWVPIEASNIARLEERRIGAPVLWSPSTSQASILQEDWEEIMDIVGSGDYGSLDARLGTYLQIRPKAMNASELTHGRDEDGLAMRSLPRGFYLRTSLTSEVLAGANA